MHPKYIGLILIIVGFSGFSLSIYGVIKYDIKEPLLISLDSEIKNHTCQERIITVNENSLCCCCDGNLILNNEEGERFAVMTSLSNCDTDGARRVNELNIILNLTYPIGSDVTIYCNRKDDKDCYLVDSPLHLEKLIIIDILFIFSILISVLIASRGCAYCCTHTPPVNNI